MTSDLVSKRTRDRFREFLVGWPKREIELALGGANIAHAASYNAPVTGERRLLVEQYYRTLDFRNPQHARQLLDAYASIIERAEQGLAHAPNRATAERDIAGLKSVLEKDGFAYRDATIVPQSLGTQRAFETVRSITEVTRRAIFDELSVGKFWWAGELTEAEFLERAGYDLDRLPSSDRRRDSMRADIWQHCEMNRGDWPEHWVFMDGRVGLLEAPDSRFTRFLVETVHPVVRPNTDDARALVALFNSHLASDGWEIVEGRAVSGKPTFLARCGATSTVALPAAAHAKDVLSNTYVRELSDKCDSRLRTDDLDGAVTVARTLLEAILGEIEERLAGARGHYKGDLPRQFKQVTKLLRMDDERSDLDERFKDVIRGLVMIANGLAPLRNTLSDGHARVRKPALHHARLVVNAAKTVASFLVESYSYQREKGLVHDVLPKPASPKPKGRH